MTHPVMDAFLSDFLGMPYVGLLVIKQERAVGEAVCTLRNRGLRRVRSWRETMCSLKSEAKIFVMLRAPLEPEFRDLIIQYDVRRGAIDILDRSHLTFCRVRFRPEAARLLLVCSERTLQAIEADYDLSREIGLVQRVDFGSGRVRAVDRCRVPYLTCRALAR